MTRTTVLWLGCAVLLTACQEAGPDGARSTLAPASLSLTVGDQEIQLSATAISAVNNHYLRLRFRGAGVRPIHVRISFTAGTLVNGCDGCCTEEPFELPPLEGESFDFNESRLVGIRLENWPFGPVPESITITAMDGKTVSGELHGVGLFGEFTIPIIHGPELAPCNAEVLAFPQSCGEFHSPCKILQRPLADGDVIFPLENL